MKSFDLKSALFVRAMEALTAFQATVSPKYLSPTDPIIPDREG